jgi:putative transposase
MIYAFIVERCADLPLEQCVRTMKVSRSAFYAWRHTQANPTPRMHADADLGELIDKIHVQRFGTYGWRRVTAELRLGLGRQVNHKRVERLTRERGRAGVTRRRSEGCTRSRATDPSSDDLVHRQFRPDRRDRLWVQDVTQHRSDEGWVYLAVVIDAWSRRVVGWSSADHMRAELVADAIDMATLRRRPPTGAIAHSDHGSNYCSWVFGQRLRASGLLGSMGTVGDALDNAVAESFFASLQCELLDRHP